MGHGAWGIGKKAKQGIGKKAKQGEAKRRDGALGIGHCGLELVISNCFQ